MARKLDRRDFLAAGTSVLGTLALTGCNAAAHLAEREQAESAPSGRAMPAPPFRISLAQWSLHRTLQSGALDHLEFARYTREQYDIDAIEYVNSFFRDRARDAAYLAEMNRRAADHGVYQHLIMCDGEGRLGDPDPAQRAEAVENHRRWLEAARTLGCATIRVNAASEGSFDEQQKLAADGLRRLSELGDELAINVIVENHGGWSSHGGWLAGVMRLVDHPRCGTLPDFGNFRIGEGAEYDRYQGTAELMPFAKAVSAKSHDFDARGEETTKDYRRLLRIVTAAGYHSWVGIEYEGSTLDEPAGVAATLRLLRTILAELQS
ncbi:MAG TPA: sugar phosphate isomerase/epimerase family protein [Longimicrobiales bacterium]|nr:sugar phosphate isomerase/epimerase family protein [Longimicrobiales bacterium]